MKQKCKKLLSIILSLTMLFSITAGIDMSAQSAVATLLWPVFDSSGKPYKSLTSHNSDKSSGHQGIDISAPNGSKWYAPYKAIVDTVYTGCKTNANGDHSKCSPNHGRWKAGNGKYICNDGFGNGIMLKCSINGSTYYIHCAHMNSVSSSLKAGQSISQGTYLGTVGDRGYSYGTHAHFQVVKGNNKWAMNTCCNDPSHSHCAFSYKYTLSTNVTNPSVTVKSISDLATTSVQLNFTANNPSKVTIKTVGVQIRRKGESTWKTKSEAMNKNYTNATSVPMWWTVGKGKEFDTTLYPGITYEYRAYVVYNSKNYYSSTNSFTTKGSHSHSVKSEITKYPTCTEYGTRKLYCTICGAIAYESVSPKGHSWDSGTVTKNPTCTQKGTKRYRCKTCNATKNGTVATSNHKYKITTTKATTSSDGKIVKTCTVCNKSTSTAIPKASNISLSATTYTYDGKVKTPSITVKDRNGKALKNGTDYSVSYASGRKNVGKYAVTVKFKGNYSGSKTIYFLIKPKGTSISSISPGTKKFTVKWKKPSTSITGYQIQYSTNSKFSNAKNVTVSKSSTTSKSITNLSVNKKYYVRVRTYKTVGSTKYYSSWSSAKYVITNK